MIERHLFRTALHLVINALIFCVHFNVDLIVTCTLFCRIALTIMIFVNYGGGGYYFFKHARWDGEFLF